MAQKLSFTTTSLNNVVISNPSDVIYYEVTTPKWAPGVTSVTKMDHTTRELEVVAEVKNEQEAPAAIRMRGEQFRAVDDFIHHEDRRTRFRGKDGRQYEWRERKGALELVNKDESDAPPVALYRRHRRFLSLKLARSPTLEIQPSVMETLDSLIVSWLLVERKRRGGAK